ncbi:hypothetical protein FNF29_00697 [Cafeteria roenbergensis]|uniref:RNA 3'-terminal phosphate cyclase domain-containing protein n=3 Tax=Cafeteria roenbergensis TaxID=33653 RepID=A0A5A8CU44_CAFRO|nr:hypothetical protein FNF29_00697 [Cafeteria roenbergensis]|eukprot:KAA0156586.1 hypothetical protein FNF29_00697 [Cafeteria roenbergensis]
MSTIEIDGSQGEGGGQVLRQSLALSCILGKPIRLHRIRGKRPKPGLKAQHLAGVNALAAIHDAEVAGAAVGSSELEFSPGAGRRGRHQIDVGTAGACTLVCQAVLPAIVMGAGREPTKGGPAARAASDAAIAAAAGIAAHPGAWARSGGGGAEPAGEGSSALVSGAAAAASSAPPAAEGEVTSLVVSGGTDVAFSPPADFAAVALLPLLRRMGVRAAAVPSRRGFFPKGGGRLDLVCHPMPAGERVRPLLLEERGEVAEQLVRVVFAGAAAEAGAAAVGVAAATALGFPGEAMEVFTSAAAAAGASAGRSGGGDRRSRDKGRNGRGGRGGRRGRGGHGRFMAETAAEAEGSGAAAAAGSGSAASKHRASESVAEGAGGSAGMRWRCELIGPEPAACSGVSVLVGAMTDNGCVLTRSAPIGGREDPVKAGRGLARELFAELAHGGCVDEHALDQLIIWMALADGESRVRCGPPSLHTTTAADIARVFLPTVEITFEPIAEGKHGHVAVVKGAGLSPGSVASARAP